jgi:RNA polymerase sigma-70 factor (ECF subfamily)
VAFSDEDIIESTRHDKAGGTRKLFERYYLPLLYHAREYLHDREEAEDTVQELFLRLWERDYLANIAAPSRLGPYLYTAVKNRCLARGRGKDPLRHAAGIAGLDIPDTLPAVDEEQATRVTTEMHRLPPRMRQVVECIVIQELKYQETADRLDISINTVKWLLKEGLRRVREGLRPPPANLLLLFLRGLRWI